MARLRALRQLAAALRGQPPRNCDWRAVIALANQSLVTPQLAAAVLPCVDGPPFKYRPFLEDVRNRNRERNARLWRPGGAGARWIAASDPRRGPRPITSGNGSAITAPPTSPTASSCADITICFCTTTAGASGIAARSW